MSYFIRVLGTDDPNIDIQDVYDSLDECGIEVELCIGEDDEEHNWSFLEVLDANGDTLIEVERNIVQPGEFGKEELDEFRVEVPSQKPATAARWLLSFFDKVEVIYAIEMYPAAFEGDNFQVVEAVKTLLWNRTEGIIQADAEGFTNEDGYHILWQFADEITGDWACAVRTPLGTWKKFTMDLGDVKQREQFKNGQMPAGAKEITS